MTSLQTVNELQKQLDSVLKFPDQNPNPVLKIDLSGKLLYSNTAGKKITSSWGIDLEERVPEAVIDHSKKELTGPLELVCGNKTFSFHIVPVPELHFICIYGTDITAMKAITKFPDQNPNPVLKIDNEGRLLYFNQAASSIQRAWGVQIGEQVPTLILKTSHQIVNKPTNEPLELEIKNKTYNLHIVPVPEFGFINIYGTDITAAKDNQTILLKLTKYFSPQVYESIFSGDLEVKIQTKRKRLTVFFSDIKGFSEITERLEPEILTEIITDYLTAMTNIAVKYGGTVDKYIGDAIMVFFGDPKTKGPKDDAIACVEMALEMNRKLSEIRKTWQAKGISQPLDIRIGVHTDTCTVGNFGSHDRLDYTTIGNGVNLASRLESNAKANQILISEDTYLLIRDVIACEKLEKINVKNIKHPIQTYEVKGKVGEAAKQIDESDDGFSLYMDPNVLKNVKQKKAMLEEALNLLNGLDKDHAQI